MSYISTDKPHVAQIQMIYDTESGVYRPILTTDRGTNLDPVPVRLAGQSASVFGETLNVELEPSIEGFLTSLNDPREFVLSSGQNNGFFGVGTGMGYARIGNSGYAYAQITTVDIIPYIPGHGVTSRFSVIFDSGVPNSFILVGLLNEEDAFAIGYSGEFFGVLHRNNREREIRKFTFTSGAATPGNVTFTINGNPNTVLLDASTPWGAARNVDTGVNILERGISGTTYGWKTEQISGDVFFIRDLSGPTTGTFSFDPGSTSSAGSFSLIKSGSNGEQSFIQQSEFNYDKLDGSGPSKINLNPQNLNLFQIKYAWHGTHPIIFYVSDNNSHQLKPFHIISWANENNYPSLGEPRFQMSYKVESEGSVTPLSIKGVGVYSAIEGKSSLIHKRFSINATKVSDTTEKPVLSILNNLINLETNSINKRRIFITRISITNESSNKAVQINIYRGKDSDLENFNFRKSLNINSSSTLIDTEATAIVNNPSTNPIESIGISPLGSVVIDINEYIIPSEVLIITSNTLSTTAQIIVTVNGREDV